MMIDYAKCAKYKHLHVAIVAIKPHIIVRNFDRRAKQIETAVE